MRYGLPIPHSLYLYLQFNNLSNINLIQYINEIDIAIINNPNAANNT